MKNIRIINASAGSGKTYSLTQKVVDALKGGLEPEALLAATFTKKAAKELKERIRARLLEEGMVGEALAVENSLIGTVNSICGRLLQEYALEAGLSPALKTLPEEDGGQVFRMAAESVISSYAEGLEPVAERLGLLGGRKGYSSEEDWREVVQRIVDASRSNLMTQEVLKESARASWDSLQKFLEEPSARNLDEEMKVCLERTYQALERGELKAKKSLAVLETVSQCYRKSIQGVLTWGDWVSLHNLDPEVAGREMVADLQDLGGQVLRNPSLHEDLQAMIQGVFDCAAEALEKYEAYKRAHGLMDFIDQETKVLELARGNEAFQASFRERISLILIDEFQDTSPIQLALYLALNELAGASVWVGDPKQAIYAFRGTDPQLMKEVVEAVGEGEILDSSWRSRGNLVALANGIFQEVFHGMGQEKVRLKIPVQRKEAAQGGVLENWCLIAKNNTEEPQALALGVRDLLARQEGLKPGDIAILCPTNGGCSRIAGSLKAAGLRASVGQGSLLETRECRLTLAALRYLNQGGDDLALTEIVHLSPGHGSNETWLRELTANPAKAKSAWREDPLIQGLDQGREGFGDRTPLEALEFAIGKVGLLDSIPLGRDPELAMRNLDLLRGLAGTYLSLCEAKRRAATVEGLLSYLKEEKPEQARSIGEETIQVLTYHKAKGLEWPWVILTGLDKENPKHIFALNVLGQEVFDPRDPLGGRSLNYWPHPVGWKSLKPLQDKTALLPQQGRLDKLALEEEQRVLYVGITRARDGLVFAMRKGSKGYLSHRLDKLMDAKGNPVLNLSDEEGAHELQVGKEAVLFQTFLFEGGLPEDLAGEREETVWLPPRTGEKKSYLPARVAPSSLKTAKDVQVCILEDFQAGMKLRGNPSMDRVGNAIHGYLGMEAWPDKEEQGLEKVRRLLQGHGVEGSLDPEEVLEAGGRLMSFLEKRWPGARVYKEWPMFLRNQEGQRFQGWIDLLLETPEGFVIVDHKSYPGPDPVAHAREYAPQLSLYREAVERATGKPVIGTLIHLPIRGLILELTLSRADES